MPTETLHSSPVAAELVRLGDYIIGDGIVCEIVERRYSDGAPYRLFVFSNGHNLGADAAQMLDVVRAHRLY